MNMKNWIRHSGWMLSVLLLVSNCGFAAMAGNGHGSQTAVSTVSNADIANEITYLAHGDAGTQYAAYVFYPLENRDEYIFQSEPMRSASMIKVFILGAVMEQVKNGHLSLNQSMTLHGYDKVGGAGSLAGQASGSVYSLDEVLRLMITQSDNTATNMVINLLGMDSINTYIQREGYRDTKLQRKMMDSVAMAAGMENYTSVRDLGHFFCKLYNRSCVSPELDDVMLRYLAGQTDTECFPAVFPQMMIAHKTGELDGLYDDGGIFYNGDAPFILVCMTEHYSSRGTAIWIMQEMAKAAALYAHPVQAQKENGSAFGIPKLESMQVEKPDIIQKPVLWNTEREKLTREYALKHYGTEQADIKPQAIILHWTAGSTWKSAYNHFYEPKRDDGSVNVSSHFLVDRDGTIYQLLPTDVMARHAIGYNWCSIGVENVGGVNGAADLTEAQIRANVKLIRYLQKQYPDIHYVFGHYEQDAAHATGLYKEKVVGYHSSKVDPGSKFMQAVRAELEK
ncbi:MAG: serine hydrolase [Selenomonadaceae bacterium]|nr:serine hydrolase [Selenomonadaceae bacterium]